MREFNEHPNPLIRFLAWEMGLFSPFMLLWGKENVGKQGWGVPWLWGVGKRPSNPGDEGSSCR